jgi:monosaccharide ABC transporter substrate-binding protein, CUT2 family (TC 3.A.1.2.-)
MRKYLRYIRNTIIILMFAVFNCILLASLRTEKMNEEEIKPKIVLIAHVYSNPYWQDIRMGAEKAAEERGAVIDFQGPDNASVEEGIKFINMAYAAKVSGIIAYVQEEEKYMPVINKVVSGGIPLVTVDSDAENSKRLAYVGTDNKAAGVEAAKEMIRQIGTKGKVGIIMGGRDVKNQIERVQGFTDYIKSNSEIAIAEIASSDSYRLEAELAAKNILMDNWDLKALFCASALDGVGAAKAVTSIGLSGKVKIICFDDLPETIEGIKRGVITSTIVQRPFAMGYKAVNIIMDNIEGKEVKGAFLQMLM